MDYDGGLLIYSIVVSQYVAEISGQGQDHFGHYSQDESQLDQTHPEQSAQLHHAIEGKIEGLKVMSRSRLPLTQYLRQKIPRTKYKIGKSEENGWKNKWWQNIRY